MIDNEELGEALRRAKRALRNLVLPTPDKVSEILLSVSFSNTRAIGVLSIHHVDRV